MTYTSTSEFTPQEIKKKRSAPQHLSSRIMHFCLAVVRRITVCQRTGPTCFQNHLFGPASLRGHTPSVILFTPCLNARSLLGRILTQWRLRLFIHLHDMRFVLARMYSSTTREAVQEQKGSWPEDIDKCEFFPCKGWDRKNLRNALMVFVEEGRGRWDMYGQSVLCDRLDVGIYG